MNVRPAGDGHILGLGQYLPTVHETAWIAPTAVVIGQVAIGAQSSIWYNSVLRGDANTISIGERSNIQDGTIVHVDPGPFSVTIGNAVTVGHACIIHGCIIQDGAMIGMGSTILNGAVVERGGVLAAGSILPAGKRIGPGELWIGAPAAFRRRISEAEAGDFAGLADLYVNNSRRHSYDLIMMTGSD